MTTASTAGTTSVSPTTPSVSTTSPSRTSATTSVCPYDMTASSDFPIESISSNPSRQDGLKDPSEDPWVSQPGDDAPSVTYVVDPSDKPIEDVEVTGTENVASVTVEVTDSNGDPVRMRIIASNRAKKTILIFFSIHTFVNIYHLADNLY